MAQTTIEEEGAVVNPDVVTTLKGGSGLTANILGRASPIFEIVLADFAIVGGARLATFRFVGRTRSAVCSPGRIVGDAIGQEFRKLYPAPLLVAREGGRGLAFELVGSASEDLVIVKAKLGGLLGEGCERASFISAGRLGRRATNRAERTGLGAVFLNIFSPAAEPFGPSLSLAHPIAVPAIPVPKEKLGIVHAFRSKGRGCSQGKDG